MLDTFKNAGYHDITYPHREILLDVISKHEPTSVLDLGCASGPDLFLIHERFPDCKLFGVEKTPQGLDAARGFGTDTTVGLLEDVIKTFADKSFDVTFTNG